MSAPGLLRIPVGVVVERRKAKSQWIDFVWRPVAVLPGSQTPRRGRCSPPKAASRPFYVGLAEIHLHRSETSNYRDNLVSGSPAVWVAMRPTETEPPFQVVMATADPSEGEAFTETGTELVEAVPMPDIVRRSLPPSSPSIMSSGRSSSASATAPIRRRWRAAPTARG